MIFALIAGIRDDVIISVVYKCDCFNKYHRASTLELHIAYRVTCEELSDDFQLGDSMKIPLRHRGLGSILIYAQKLRLKYIFLNFVYAWSNYSGPASPTKRRNLAELLVQRNTTYLLPRIQRCFSLFPLISLFLEM